MFYPFRNSLQSTHMRQNAVNRFSCYDYFNDNNN